MHLLLALSLSLSLGEYFINSYQDTPVIFVQTLIGAVLSAPINPVVASTLFILSYVRPIKYWEKDYK